VGVPERRAREFDRREQEILSAALVLFRGEEWETVTVEQIAQQAEIGKGTVYKHFASKDEIYARLALDFQRAILASIERIDPKLSVTERCRAILRSAWEAHLASEELHRVLLYCSRREFRSNLSPATAREFDALDTALHQALSSLIRHGMAQGIFARKPLPLLLFGARAAFWGAIQLAWGGQLAEREHEPYLEALSSFMLAGLMYQDRVSEPTRRLRKS
jgi:AcrR family transcriptional regulator